MGLVHLAHCVGIGVVPGSEVFDICRFRIAQRNGINQSLFKRCQLGRICLGTIDRRPRRLQRVRLLVLFEGFPGLVVIGANGIGDAPIGHGTVRISLQRLSEALNRFFMMIGEHPDQPAIKPLLGLWRVRCDGARIVSKIIICHESLSTKLLHSPCTKTIRRLLSAE